MLRSWLAALAMLVTLIPATGSAQMAFIQGKDYQAVAQPVDTGQPGKVVVTELFWYGCPHCFRFEPYVERWSANLPEGAVFEQVPAVGNNPEWPKLARTYYALKSMGELERLHRNLFDAIHIERKPLQAAELDQIAEYLAGQGVDAQAFREAYNSFPVETQMRKNKQKENRYGIGGVPTIIVNGKYVVSTELAGSFQRMLEITDFLVRQELDR